MIKVISSNKNIFITNYNWWQFTTYKFNLVLTLLCWHLWCGIFSRGHSLCCNVTIAVNKGQIYGKSAQGKGHQTPVITSSQVSNRRSRATAFQIHGAESQCTKDVALHMEKTWKAHTDLHFRNQANIVRRVYQNGVYWISDWVSGQNIPFLQSIYSKSLFGV